jgi:hypothetical protein
MFSPCSELDTQKRSFFRTEATNISLSWFIDKINLALFVSFYLKDKSWGADSSRQPRAFYVVYPKRRSMDDGLWPPKVDRFLCFCIE